jgi:hypothetical protein
LKGRKNDDTTISNDVMGILSGLADPFGEFVPGLAKSLIDSQLQPDNGADNNGTLLTHGGTFDATKIPGHSLSTEMGFALEHVPRAVEIIVRQTHKYLFPGLPALRYVRPSTAHLAFARYSPYTCTIEIPAIASRRSQEGIESIWEALKQEQIPYTFHWGQCLRWGDSPLESLQRLQHVFGDRLQQWLQARRDFFSSTQGNCWTFSNPMVQQCGLAEDCPRT